MKRTLFLILSSAIILAACEEKVEPVVKEEVKETYEMTKVEETETMKILPFEKEIHVVRIKEENNSALNKELRDGIATTKATPGEVEDSLDIYNNAPKPNESTESIIIYEAYNKDELIFSTMYLSDEQVFKQIIEEADNEAVDNSGRLFVGREMSVKANGTTVTFRISNESLEIPKKSHIAEDYFVELEDEDKYSKLIIENLGKIPSKHIRYQEIEGAYILDDSELTGEGWENAKNNIHQSIERAEKEHNEEE